MLGLFGACGGVRGRVLRYGGEWSLDDGAAAAPPRVTAVLATLHGSLDGTLLMTPADGDAASSTVVWSGADAVATEAAASVPERAKLVDTHDPLPAELVWRATSRALADARWDEAKAHKSGVERLARAAKARRAKQAHATPHAAAADSANFAWTDAEGWAPRA